MSQEINKIRSEIDSAISATESRLATLRGIRNTLANVPADRVNIKTPAGRPSATRSRFLLDVNTTVTKTRANKATTAEPQKRGPGRPKGSKNAPKADLAPSPVAS